MVKNMGRHQWTFPDILTIKSYKFGSSTFKKEYKAGWYYFYEFQFQPIRMFATTIIL